MNRREIVASHPILIVEDSAEDFEATRRAFQKVGISNPIIHSEDGEDALDCLYGRGRFAGNPEQIKPIVILLDLNLPGTDGREVLQTIKQDPQLKSIPVIILTTSADDRDINACYEMGANSYVQKPVNLSGFLESMQRIKDYWFDIVLLPRLEQL